MVVVRLESPTRTAVDDYRLESVAQDVGFSCWYDYRPGANKIELGVKYGLSSRVWPRMTSNSRLIDITGDMTVRSISLNPKVLRKKRAPGKEMGHAKTQAYGETEWRTESKAQFK